MPISFLFLIFNISYLAVTQFISAYTFILEDTQGIY